MTSTPEAVDALLPCKHCGTKPHVFSTNNPPIIVGGWMAICGFTECKNPLASIGKTESEAVENWNVNNSTPAPEPDADAVEALAIARFKRKWPFGDWNEQPEQVKAGYLKIAAKYAADIASAGYTLRRETMSDAELQSEVENLAKERLSIVGQPDIVFSTPCLVTVDDAIAIVKKFRG